MSDTNLILARVVRHDVIWHENTKTDPNYQTIHHTSQEHKFRPSCAIPIVAFLPSLRISGNDKIMSSGALHQITTGRVCLNNVDQSVPHHNIRNLNIYPRVMQ